MKGILNKGFVKYSLVLTVLALCLVLFTLYGPAIGKGKLHETNGAETGITNKGLSVEVMDFYEVVDNEGEEEPPEIKESDNKPPETNDASPKTQSGGGSSGGGGSPSIQCPGIQCPPPTHKVCDYGQQACVVVQGEGVDQCENFEDCIHTECDYEEEVCLTIESPGEDECETNEDCTDECIPPYLEVDKEANPTELYCEETTITLTIEGKGEVCDQHYPVDVVLIFDNSGSMDDDGWDDNISDWQPIGDAKIAAKTFVDFLGSNDKLGLVSFNTDAKLEQGLTFNKNAVKSAIDGMSAGGWTNMSQGIDYGTQELVTNGRLNVPWVEVMLSDGNNNCGSKSPPPDCHQRVFDSVQEAVDNGIIIYTIALGKNANQSLMEDIANLTGGKSYYAPDSEDLKEIYEEIAEEVITIVAGTNVVVIDYLPYYVELNESTLPVECEYDDIERKIACELGTVNINETFEISFNVYLYQLGYNLTNVYPDSGVEYLNYNETIVFEEFPETYVTVYGCEHTFCNYVDMICDIVVEVEPGEDECVTFDDCPHHKICDYGQQACVMVEGTGTDECQTYDDCFHDICDYKSLTCENVPITLEGDSCETDEDCYHMDCVEISCLPVMGGGDDLCSQDSDCYYMRCDYGQQACLPTIGYGDDECSTFDDCIHTECNYVDLTCDTVPSQGISECVTFNDCPKHKVCDYIGQQCKIVEGTGVNECQTYDDCFHDICNYQSFTCVEVPITEPGDSCVTNSDCFDKICDYGQQICKKVEPGTPGTSCSTYNDCVHTECCGMSCITSQSPGSDECSTEADCTDYVCQDISCVAVAGTGQVECMDDDDCRHYECNYIDEICEPVAGEGADECETFEDCYYCGDGVLDPGEECEIAGVYAGWGPWGHEYTCKEDNTYYHCVNCQYEHVNECEYYCSGDFECDGHPPMTYLETCDYGYDYLQDYCNEICELEDNNCEDDYAGCTSYPECDELEPNTGDCNYMCQYKPSHMQCNYQKLTCELVGTPGDDECVTFDDCPHHKICDYILDQCKIVEGEGIDNCATFSDCIHTECNYISFTCDAIEAPGTDECITFEDCEQHRVCDYIGQQCKMVEGSGLDECQTYDDCFHDICDYSMFTCEEVPVTEEGDACAVNSDCYDKVCDYGQDICKKVEPGTPGVACNTYDDCIHSVCEGMSCVDDDSPGTAECQDNFDCTDYICNYNKLTCDAVAGSGYAECTTFNDCPQHKVCDYEQFVCKIVEGTGTDECQTWADCAFCGDGEVNPPEECELPGTNNNLYCSQTTQTCSGNKLGTRDAYGNCNSVCGCVDDPFTYSCVEGTCGAECDSDDDCDCPADGCDVYNYKYPTYFDFPDYSECSTEDCSCSECEAQEIICDPRCMGECEVTVRLEHEQGNKENYDQWPHDPFCGTYDICMVIETNGQCRGWRIPVKYWWCQCPNFNPDQEDIEYSVWPPKWNRLCTANAGNPNTDSLYCAPCEWRTYVADFRQSDLGKIRFCTDVGIATGTYQIDIREYNDCYERKAAVALGCAGHLEDQPTHLECSNKMCQEVAGIGDDQCNKDSDCYFYKCVDQACVKRAGTQADQCSTDADCVIETHTECSGLTCVEVTGSGTDQCSQDCDCYHLECSNKACVQVAGDGQDLCSVDGDCYFYKCVDQACVKRAGTQADQCSTDADCVIIEYHNECIGFKCEPVLGSGSDECFDNFECEVPMV